ncbi:MAG: hypothetical protein ACW968_07545 [Candidatus Thorarchaeota archaeon]|jgi:hypothetical protein
MSSPKVKEIYNEIQNLDDKEFAELAELAYEEAQKRNSKKVK